MSDIFIDAIINKDLNKIKYLSKNKANLINQKGSSGNTPLHEAVRMSQTSAEKQDNKTALEYQKIAHYLIKHGGDLQIKNNKGEIILDRKQTQNSKPILLDDYEMVGGKKKKH